MKVWQHAYSQSRVAGLFSGVCHLCYSYACPFSGLTAHLSDRSLASGFGDFEPCEGNRVESASGGLDVACGRVVLEELIIAVLCLCIASEGKPAFGKVILRFLSQRRFIELLCRLATQFDGFLVVARLVCRAAEFHLTTFFRRKPASHFQR